MTTPKHREEKGHAPSSTKRGKSPLAGYDWTPSEKVAAKRALQRRVEAPPAPRIKVKQTDSRTVSFSFEHENQPVGQLLLAEALGSADMDFINGLLGQLANAAKRNGTVAEADINFLISVIKDIKPRDQLEAMLVAEMAVVHEATMAAARRLGNIENILQQDSAVNALTKLTRTFAVQMEALKRYRSAAEQKVTVQHVNISDGGQAIVGNVSAGREKNVRKPTPSAPTLTHSSETPMPPIRTGRATVRVPRQRNRKSDRKSST
jgi:hypothetical protein